MKMWRKCNLSFENSLPLPLFLSLSLPGTAVLPAARPFASLSRWMDAYKLVGGLGQTDGRGRTEGANATTASLPSCQLRTSAWSWEGVPQKQTYRLYDFAK